MRKLKSQEVPGSPQEVLGSAQAPKVGFRRALEHLPRDDWKHRERPRKSYEVVFALIDAL